MWTKPIRKCIWTFSFIKQPYFFPSVFFSFLGESFLVGLGRKNPGHTTYFSSFPPNQTHQKNFLPIFSPKFSIHPILPPKCIYNYQSTKQDKCYALPKNQKKKKRSATRLRKKKKKKPTFMMEVIINFNLDLSLKLLLCLPITANENLLLKICYENNVDITFLTK